MSGKLIRDLLIGAFLIIGSIYFYGVSTALPKSSATFPQIILIAIIALSAIMLLQTFLKEKTLREAEAKAGKTPIVWLPYLVYLVVVAFIVVFRFVGYFPASVLLIVGLMLFFKVKSWKLLVGVPAVYCLFVYALFVWQFSLKL